MKINLRNNLIFIFSALLIFIISIFYFSCSQILVVNKAPDKNPDISAQRLTGFSLDTHFNEQYTSYTFNPDVRVIINAPSPEKFDKAKLTNIILYTLPNGNTIEWTIGKKVNEGDDWHYGIQHIGAQTRRLREVMTDENIVVVYLQAKQKSWPTWRKNNENSSKLIGDLIQDILSHFEGLQTKITLSGHSGGGSFIFGYINGIEAIPDYIERICFLDSNYAYDDNEKHGDKIINWLRSSNKHFLEILCYDDRNVILNGKHIVSRTGGTWGRTEAMVERIKKDIELKTVVQKDCVRYRGLDDRIDIIMHTNPENKILHTVLVGDMNGFIHVITSGTKYENKAGLFNGPLAYEAWIQNN